MGFLGPGEHLVVGHPRVQLGHIRYIVAGSAQLPCDSGLNTLVAEKPHFGIGYTTSAFNASAAKATAASTAARASLGCASRVSPPHPHPSQMKSIHGNTGRRPPAFEEIVDGRELGR